MTKWRLVRVVPMTPFSENSGRIHIFPYDQLELDWLFKQFPKATKSKVSGKYLVIETHSHLVGDMVDAVWLYLGDNGWEYCGDNFFKRILTEGN